MGKDNNRQRVVDAASQRFEHFGYKKTTVDEIASDAGISKGAVYLHFENKDAILLEVVHQGVIEQLDEWNEIAKKDIPSKQKIDEMYCYWVEAVMHRKGKYFGGDHLEMQLMKQDHGKFVSLIRPLVVGALAGIIRQEIKAGGIKDNVAPEELATVIALQIYTAIHAPETIHDEWKHMWKILWKYLGDAVCVRKEEE